MGVWGAGQKVWRGKAGQAEARAGISSTLSCCRTSSPRAFLHSLLTPNPRWPNPGREADAHWPERCGSNHHHCLAGKLRPSEEVRPINDWSRAGSSFCQHPSLFILLPANAPSLFLPKCKIQTLLKIFKMAQALRK